MISVVSFGAVFTFSPRRPSSLHLLRITWIDTGRPGGRTCGVGPHLPSSRRKVELHVPDAAAVSSPFGAQARQTWDLRKLQKKKSS